MGNCLVLQTSMVRIMKSDGKTLKYKTPIKVHQILKQFSNHAVSDSDQLMYLHPNTKLLNGQLYYLVPLSPSSPKASKKKVRFAEPEVEGEARDENGLIRVKLVISKQELQDIVHKGGISVNEILSLVHDEKEVDGSEDVCRRIDYGSQVWKPALESIPEVN